MPNSEVRLHDEAAAEYDAAFDWYLEHSPDSALKFDAEVERAFAEIARAPRRWVRGSYGTRRFLLRGFPFLVIYRETSAESVQILAVAHASRRPGYWKARM
ncbi:MAG: type II toxin-antitoxin system RelE/ParE family toxin [Terriglobales bacterium]